MMFPRSLHAAAGRLPAQLATGRMFEDDRWRLANAYYGALAWPIGGRTRPIIVYLGARSGLEIVTAFLRSPEATVVAVEPDRERRSMIGALFAAPKRGIVVADISEACQWLAGRHVDFLRVDGCLFAASDIEALLGETRCGHLCGTYMSGVTDPLTLYRLSRDRLARSFFWRDEAKGEYLGSDRGPVDVEVSVVVPAYKVGVELEQCLQSLADQSLARLEVLVVNDGSPDDTGERAEAWAARHPGRITVIHKPNGGCASARMAGIQASRGEFIGFVDADDWVAPAMFQELYRAAILRGAEIAQCGYAEVFADGSRVGYDDCDDIGGRYDFPRVISDTLPYLAMRPTVWRRIYRRDFVRQNGLQFPEHIRRFDDLPFQFEALTLAKRMALIPDCYYFYRQGRPGQDIAVRDDRLFVHFEIFNWLRARLMSWADARVEAQLVRLELNTHRWALSRVDPAFRVEYLRRARAQVLGNRVHIRPLHVLRISARMGRTASGFVAGALLLHAIGSRDGQPDGASVLTPGHAFPPQSALPPAAGN